MYVYLNPRYRYRATGGFVDYPGVAPELFSCRTVTPPCNYQTKDVTPTRLEHILPFYLETRNSWADTTFAKDITFDRPGARFYGCLADPADPPPPAQNYSLPELVEGGTMSRKDFERAKRDGRIVVQRRIKASVNCLVRPGFNVEGLTPTQVTMVRAIQGALPRVASCNGTKGVPLVDDSTRIMGTGPDAVVETNNYVVYDRYSYHPSQGRWYLPTPRLAGHLMEFVRSKVLSITPNEEVVTRALADANNRYWDILTEVAELPELIGYILRALKDILQMCRTFEKKRRQLMRNWQGSAETLGRQLAEWWLEFRYAIMPLVGSVEDAIKYLTSATRIYTTTRKSGGSEIPALEADGWISQDPIHSLDRCFIKRRFGHAVDSVFLTVNPLTTMWEKVSFSFVVDWVFNVGDLVTSLVNPSGVEQEAATASSQVNNSVVTFTNAAFPGASVRVRINSYRLDPITPLGHVGLTLRPDMTWKRWLDAIALVWVRMKQEHIREMRYSRG